MTCDALGLKTLNNNGRQVISRQLETLCRKISSQCFLIRSDNSGYDEHAMAQIWIFHCKGAAPDTPCETTLYYDLIDLVALTRFSKALQIPNLVRHALVCFLQPGKHNLGVLCPCVCVECQRKLDCAIRGCCWHMGSSFYILFCPTVGTFSMT